MRKAGIIIGIILVVLCGGIGWFAYQTFALTKEITGASVTQQQFDAQQVGAKEPDVRAALPEPLSGVTDKDIYGDDPAKQGMPAGASCIYYTVKPLTQAGGQPIYRFCFVGGALAEKSRITIAE